MSGGHFDYQQYQVGYIADRIEEDIREAMKPKPPKVKKHSVNIWENHNNGSARNWSHEWRLDIKTKEEAHELLLSNRNIEYKDGRYFDKTHSWLDEEMNEHPYEYTISEYDYEEYEDGGYYTEIPDDILEEFKNAVHHLRVAAIYAQRVDWYMSGDDGEESFRSRLKQDLEELTQKEKDLWHTDQDAET